MRPMYIVDLDDNLGQVAKKCPQGEGELRLFSVDREGQPGSFMTAKQSALFDIMRTSGDITPCTGRDLGAYQRMRIPLSGYAIVSFGAAIVMPDGSFEQRWMEQTEAEAAVAASSLAELLGKARELTEKYNLSLEVQSMGEVFGDKRTPLFVLVKQREAPVIEMNFAHTTLAGILPAGWKAHRNSSTLALMPPFLRKGFAVKFLLENVLPQKPIFTVGMGDSTDDGGFMGLCDFAMMPTSSQIFGLIRKEVADVPR